MKKLITILIVSLILSCSTDDLRTTQCTQEFYEIQTSIWWDAQNNPHTVVDHVFLYEQPTSITQEGQTYTSDNTYFLIVCDE